MSDAPRYVTINWPADPDRGTETYGPFSTSHLADLWVQACIDAEDAGWELLKGAHYKTHPISEPFDADELINGMRHDATCPQDAGMVPNYAKGVWECDHGCGYTGAPTATRVAP